MVTYALDFETYYDKECSIKTLGPLGYFSHPNFDAYMVSVVGDDGYKFVGNPKDFDWSLIKDSIVLSHNASFDETLYLFGVDRGWWDYSEVKAWYCTADMAAFCRLPRSLKNATAEAFGLTVDKSTRDNMSGKKWNNMTDEFKEEVSEYALKDSELCLDLWKKYSDQWPDSEKEISNLNRKIVQGGIPIDQSLLKDQLEKVKVRLFEAEQNIPWIEESPSLSRAAFDNQCRLVGLEPPASLAATDEKAQEWIDHHSEKHKWITSVRDWRRINAIKKKLESFDYATMPDSRFYGGIMYFGAHTGRFSGSGGNLNLQNLPREEMFGANLRHLIAPKEGRKLIVVDLSQIEVRTLCWLAEDKNMLAEIADTDDIYEAFAIRFKMWGREKGLLKKEDPKLRHIVKALVLGCGYGVGVDRFASMTGFSVDQAREGIARYRYFMPKIKGYWSILNNKIKKAHAAKVDLVHVLPSKRELNYGKIKRVSGDRKGFTRRNFFNDYIAAIPKNGKKLPVRLWGGLLAENLSQALARDIFSDMMMRLDKAGHKIIFHVHDEVIIEEDADKAEEAYKDIVSIMSNPPKWIPDIPLQAEGEILTKYEK